MPALTVNFDLCDECMKCEKVLPTYISNHKGYLYISYARSKDSAAVKNSIKSVISCCPQHAITLEQA